MTLLYFVLMVGVLIFVHELGHFLFAKLFDVKVIRFSLGFGPRALGFQYKETEYGVSWLPLGGYVKMLGEDPADEIRQEDQGRAFHQKPLWQRYIIVLAGPAFNVIFPTLIYFVFFVGQTALPASVIGKVFQNHPAAEAGLSPGDRIVAINGESIRFWDELKSEVARSPGHALRFTVKRKDEVFERFVTPKKYTRRNRLGTVEEYGLIGISPYFELTQVGLSSLRSAAAKAGLRTGDVIVAVNGHPVESWTELNTILKRTRGHSLRLVYLRPEPLKSRFSNLFMLRAQTTVLDPQAQIASSGVGYDTGLHSAEFFVHLVEPGSPAERIGMKIGDRIVAIDKKPITNWEMFQMELRRSTEKERTITWIPLDGKRRSARFRLQRKVVVDEYKQEQVRYVFGASNQLLWRDISAEPIPNRISRALVASVQKTGEIVGTMALAILQLFRGTISGDTIGGPVMLAYTARVAAEKGWDHFLWIMALISINLGIINLLPVPILDGGHIMFFTIEAIKRRPLSLRAREIASYVGLFLLISLMMFALKNDIVRYWMK